ncbi:hypothetical protein PMR45_07390 [Bifidobacterium longum]|nr:hypothetical protein [Bifidobacterium longum]
MAGSSAPVSHVPSMMGAGMILVRSASVMMMVTRRISVLPSSDDAHMARSLR